MTNFTFVDFVNIYPFTPNTNKSLVMIFNDAVNPQTDRPTTGSPISAFAHIRRKGRLLGFLFLVLALGAALIVAVDSEPRPAFADLSGLPTDTGFPSI